MALHIASSCGPVSSPASLRNHQEDVSAFGVRCLVCPLPFVEKAVNPAGIYRLLPHWLLLHLMVLAALQLTHDILEYLLFEMLQK